VPSFASCSTPNRAHGPPLGFGSCNLPSPTSPNVTVGTPDVNGAAANSVGSVRLTVFPPPPFPDDADFGIEMSFSDIRCGSGTTACGPANDRAGADYTGELRIELAVRLTDKVAYEPTTTQDFTFPIRVGCSGSSSTATGAICSADTSANAVLPGSVHDGLRTIWQLGEIRLLDGGADGDADTTADNRLFATQGVFVP